MTEEDIKMMNVDKRILKEELEKQNQMLNYGEIDRWLDGEPYLTEEMEMELTMEP